MKKKKREEFFSEEINQQEIKFVKDSTHHPDALTAEEILNIGGDSNTQNSALDFLLKRMTGEETEEKPEEKSTTDSKPEKSLLDKCMPYILDDDGNNASVNAEPLYKLESVAEILKADSEKTLEKLSKEYGMVFEDISAEKPSKEEPEAVAEEIPTETKTEPEIEEVEKSTKNDIPIISDIDMHNSLFYSPKAENEEISEETVTFTPIVEKGEKNSKIFISTHTKPIDFTDELIKINPTTTPEAEEIQLEESEFEEYSPKDEYSDLESGKALFKKFVKNKKQCFISMWGSILLTLATAFFMLPFMSNVILSHSRVCMIITTAFILFSSVLNYKTFAGLSKIFRSRSDGDVAVSLSAICVLAYCVFGIINEEIILNTQVFSMIILSFSAIRHFIAASAQLRSFKQIFHKNPKHAITFLDDPAITMAMTKGSVEGDCLIAAPQGTSRISDFMKYSTFGNFLNGKSNIITTVSLLIALLIGFLSATLSGSVSSGLYAASAILCISALPSISLINALPLYSSAKKLATRGAMIAGMAGAVAVEQANAVVINAKDIFPSGTVTMQRMQVLSENNLQDTIIRAASLTEALQSPLAPIFKKIAGTGNITVFPDSDTVKYEEAMGISGWVDNRLLFIGNRTLMEAHGITVPDLEIDRKILRGGYFPIYVADQNKACALIVVNYDVDPKISKELRRLTNNGVTLLLKSSDPNLTEEMVCDYFGLYEDSVKVMSAAGCHIYVNTVTYTKKASAPAAFRTSPLALPTILNCADRIRRSNIVLIASYIISAVFGILLFTYASFGGTGELLSDSSLLLYGVISTILTYLLYLTQKP